MNLIVTCPRNFEDDAAGELAAVFERLGLDEPSVRAAPMPGILTAIFDARPENIIQKTREIITDEPWYIRYIQRMIPICDTVCSDIDDITDAAKGLATIMGDADTYRITVEKRHSGLSTSSIISGIAGIISNRVSLEEPDWVVLVEIIGSAAGVSIIRPLDILSVEKTKRQMSQ